MENYKEELINQLAHRKMYLEKLLHQALSQDSELKNVPMHKLRVEKHGKGYQYYMRNSKSDTSGTYVKKDQLTLVQKILQKEYLNKFITAINEELSTIDRYFLNHSTNKLSNIYESLSPGRKIMVTPLEISDNEYIKDWYNIPYKYECPLYLKGYGVVYPDFTVLNIKSRKELYFEHFGMIDNLEYREKAMQKIELYEKNNIFIGDKLIVTYESTKQPLNSKLLERKIKHFFL